MAGSGVAGTPYFSDIAPGTSAANKAVVLDKNSKIDALDITTLSIGGTALTCTAAELNTAADLSAQGALVRVKKISITATPDGSEQDTGFDLPTKGIVLDVFVDVTTAEATGGTKALDVGLLSSESGGDADGFLDGVSVAAVAQVRGVPTVTTGVNEVYFASCTLGALLVDTFTAGADTATDVGTFAPRPHVLNGTAKSVTYTAGSNDWAEFRGDIYIVYVELG